MTSQRRVCITGIGVITPLGNDPDSLWKNISAGNSGITLNEDLPESVPSRIWGQPEPISLDGFASSIMMPLKKSDRFIQYGAYAARQAMLDAYGQDKLPDDLSLRCGVAIGSGIGGLDRIIEQYEFMKEKNRTSPFFISSTIINEVAGVVSIVSNARGPNFSLVSACATGAHNIGHAARAIQYGEADIMLAGGSEALLGPLAFFGFSANRALSRRNDDPQGASRPWDADRDGFVMSNGAGVVVLEELTMARNRGADIYAEVIGYGMSGDAHHITAPREDGDGMIRCMNASLADAGLAPEDILYINAHATSTPLGDSIESRAVEQVFGAHAQKLCLSASKSMIGHMLGAAGSVEAILTVLALRNQKVPPTINLDQSGADCRLDYVPGQSRELSFGHAISNSFGFGGTNVSLVFQKGD